MLKSCIWGKFLRSICRKQKAELLFDIAPAERQFDTPGACDCAVHLENYVQYASILQ